VEEYLFGEGDRVRSLERNGVFQHYRQHIRVMPVTIEGQPAHRRCICRAIQGCDANEPKVTQKACSRALREIDMKVACKFCGQECDADCYFCWIAMCPKLKQWIKEGQDSFVCVSCRVMMADVFNMPEGILAVKVYRNLAEGTKDHIDDHINFTLPPDMAGRALRLYGFTFFDPPPRDKTYGVVNFQPHVKWPANGVKLSVGRSGDVPLRGPWSCVIPKPDSNSNTAAQYGPRRPDKPIRVGGVDLRAGGKYCLRVEDHIERDGPNALIRTPFMVVVAVTRPGTAASIVDMITRHSHIGRNTCRQKLLSMLRTADAAAHQVDDDIEVAGEAQTLSRRDPVTMDDIKVPVRGRDCKHLECIDLQPFVDMAKNNDSSGFKGRWKCPQQGCNASLYPWDIYIDDFVSHLLNHKHRKADEATNKDTHTHTLPLSAVSFLSCVCCLSRWSSGSSSGSWTTSSSSRLQAKATHGHLPLYHHHHQLQLPPSRHRLYRRCPNHR